MVTSPGGTTIAAIRELEIAGVRAAFLNAIQAAMVALARAGGGRGITLDGFASPSASLITPKPAPPGASTAAGRAAARLPCSLPRVAARRRQPTRRSRRDGGRRRPPASTANRHIRHHRCQPPRRLPARPPDAIASAREQRPARERPPVHVVPRLVSPAAPPQARALDRRDRDRAAHLQPRRLGRPGLVRAPVGHDDLDLDRVHRRRAHVPDGPDDTDGARLVLHPRRGLPGRRRPLPRHPRRVRDGRRDERFPAGQHRHVRVAADVRRADPRLHLLRRPRRDGGAEDLLHGDRGLRLPLPLPLGAGDVRPRARRHHRPLLAVRGDRRRRRRARVSRDQAVLARSSRASGTTRSRAARSWRSRATTSSRCSCRPWLVDREVDRDRDLPRRLQHPGHVPLGHVGRRRELAREQPSRSHPAASASRRRSTASPSRA